mmetsp:Transcript_30665/g.78325  ORF Transcript_30665/g.78325 Transcript_30665/m.78325 type:complete len:359 (+) Transcript_30665:172-1248(+)
MKLKCSTCQRMVSHTPSAVYSMCVSMRACISTYASPPPIPINTICLARLHTAHHTQRRTAAPLPLPQCPFQFQHQPSKTTIHQPRIPSTRATHTHPQYYKNCRMFFMPFAFAWMASSSCLRRPCSLSSAPNSFMASATGLGGGGGCSSPSATGGRALAAAIIICCPRLIASCNPSITTCRIAAGVLTSNRAHSSLTTPSLISPSATSWVMATVAAQGFASTYAHSLRSESSADRMSSATRGNTPASSRAPTCALEPAATLDSDQMTSFLMDSRPHSVRHDSMAGTPPASTTACVCADAPLHRLPSTRSAGVVIVCVASLTHSTSLASTLPDSVVEALSLVPGSAASSSSSSPCSSPVK